MERIRELAETAMLQQAGVKKHQGRLDKKNEEIGRYRRLLCSLYENLTEGVIDREEYQGLKKNYTALLSEAEKQAEAIRTEIGHIMERGGEGKKYQNLTVLDRAIVVSLIERILIYRDKQVEIVYNWQDEYPWPADLRLRAQEKAQLSKTGVV